MKYIKTLIYACAVLIGLLFMLVHPFFQKTIIPFFVHQGWIMAPPLFIVWALLGALIVYDDKNAKLSIGWLIQTIIQGAALVLWVLGFFILSIYLPDMNM